MAGNRGRIRREGTTHIGGFQEPEKLSTLIELCRELDR